MISYPGLMWRFLGGAGLAATLSVAQASAIEGVVVAGEQVSVSSVASGSSNADAASAVQGKDADYAMAANASQSATVAETPAGRAMTSAQRPQPKRNRVAASQSAHRNRRVSLVAACSEFWCGQPHFSLMLGVGF